MPRGMNNDILERRIDRLKAASNTPGRNRSAQIREMHDIWFHVHNGRLRAKFLTINRRHVELEGDDET